MFAIQGLGGELKGGDRVVSFLGPFQGEVIGHTHAAHIVNGDRFGNALGLHLLGGGDFDVIGAASFFKGRFGNQNLPPDRVGLNAIGQVDLGPHHAIFGSFVGTDVADHHFARVDANAHFQGLVAHFAHFGVHAAHGLLHGDRTGDRPFAIVRSGGGGPKQHQNPIPHELIDRALKVRDRIGHGFQVKVNDFDHPFRGQPFGGGREPSQIGGQDGDFAPLPAHFQALGIFQQIGHHFIVQVSAKGVADLAGGAGQVKGHHGRSHQPRQQGRHKGNPQALDHGPLANSPQQQHQTAGTSNAPNGNPAARIWQS